MGNEKHYADAFLGVSNKFYPWTFPSKTPIALAQRVAKRFDDELRRILKACLPELELRASVYKSGGSADENHPRGGGLKATQKAKEGLRRSMQQGTLLHESSPEAA